MKNLSKYLSERTAELPDSTIGALIKIAEEDKAVISLGPGEPDFGTPKEILNYGKKILSKGFTHYSPPGGRTDFKKAIDRKLGKENGIKLDDPLKQVVVTNGSTEAIMMGLMCLVDAGEEVLTPNPGFLAYIPSIKLLNGFAVEIPLKEETGFQIDSDEIKKSISKRTRAIIVNSPSNPTGTVLKKKDLEELADIAVENELLLISDEAYEYFVYGNAKHVSMASLNGMQPHVLTLHTFSKSYAMPGFRLGFASGPEWLIEKMTKIHVYTALCAPTFSQKLGEFALGMGKKPVEKMRKEYERRRKMVLRRLRELNGLTVDVEPEGAFYVFPRIDSGENSFKFAKKVLEKAKVAVVPGTEFGAEGEGFVRMSYATKYELIEKAFERLEKFFRHG